MDENTEHKKQYNKDYYKKHKEKLLEESKASRLDNRKTLLIAKGFPGIMAPLVRINKSTVSASFKTPEDLRKFLSIAEDMLKEMDAVNNN